MAVFHYLSLHKSPFFLSNNSVPEIPNADFYSDRLLRLPLYYDLTAKHQSRVINAIKSFYNS